jgi:hypothetical protein
LTLALLWKLRLSKITIWPGCNVGTIGRYDALGEDLEGLCVQSAFEVFAA